MLSLAEIDRGLTERETLFADILFDFQRQEIQNITELVGMGLEPADITAENLFAHRDDLGNQLRAAMEDTQEFGRGQANDELDRQRKDADGADSPAGPAGV